ncbi:Sodium/calcium exchanger protein-domain-containing protein [Aspergillus multicolor]|uniref:sodium:calcium antiporter n=1 Tax=Aspergillus multicolor TaxID=41759 RepID=UPI003CCCA6D0
MNWDNFCFNTATFIAGVFVLDYGTDKFLDHTVIVGRRLGIAPTLIALLTAGAEYEELAVVIAALIQHRSPLALGNMMGSAISNILGAFSLGLICQPRGMVMDLDRNAKIYSVLQLAVSTIFVILAFFDLLNRVTGGILVALFGLYIVSVGYAVYRGIAEPPELSDNDSDTSVDEAPAADPENQPQRGAAAEALESSPLLDIGNPLAEEDDAKGRPRPLYYHILQLLLGLLALSLSGYILAHSAGAIADSLHLSGTIFGLTIIAFATTLPEKLISVLSGIRGQGGIVVATTAGSNIFLLTLCVGVVALAGGLGNARDTDSYVLFDLGMVWASAACLTAVVFFGPSRVAGLILLTAYVAFLGLEFTVYRR